MYRFHLPDHDETPGTDAFLQDTFAIKIKISDKVAVTICEP
jgi:hypothetical protein